MTAIEKLEQVMDLLRVAGVNRMAQQAIEKTVIEYGKLCRFMTPEEEAQMTAGEHPHENAD